MTETRYYHLTKKSTEDALPELLQKTLQRGWRAVVILDNEENVKKLNNHLWTYDNESFLPHGSKGSKPPINTPETQPIWLTSEDENPNDANVLFLCDGVNSENILKFDLICRLFNGNDANIIDAARKSWKEQKKSGHDLTYWQQADNGGWNKK